MKVAVSFLLLVLGFALIPVATADQWNKKTVFTFSGPVEVPGMVLPAGTYVFKLLDSPAERHIVQIYNEKQTKLYTTILAVPDYRMEPRGKTVISMYERPTGSPEALHAWFYPGDNFGHEFVFTMTQARDIAKQTNEHVLYVRGDNGDLTKGEIRVMEPSGQEIDLSEGHKHR